MATPHIAGSVALLWPARPELRPDLVATEGTLNSGAVHINSRECGDPGPPNNVYGWCELMSWPPSIQPGHYTDTSTSYKVTVSVDPTEISEGDTATYTVTASSTPTRSITVGYVMSGTATGQGGKSEIMKRTSEPPYLKDLIQS